MSDDGEMQLQRIAGFIRGKYPELPEDDVTAIARAEQAKAHEGWRKLAQDRK